MTFCLDTTIINPEKDVKIENAVILLHGYGGDGKDISMLSLNWKRHLTNTIFLSGKIINQEDLKQRKRTSTNILLIHGDSDQVVSPNYMLEAKDFFIRSNIEIETHLIKNCDHHIPIEASSIALNYILKKNKMSS